MRSRPWARPESAVSTRFCPDPPFPHVLALLLVGDGRPPLAVWLSDRSGRALPTPALGREESKSKNK